MYMLLIKNADLQSVRSARIDGLWRHAALVPKAPTFFGEGAQLARVQPLSHSFRGFC